MNSKAMVWIGMTVGSTLGGLIPNLWGASFLSFSSILFSGLGAIVGIWISFKISRGY
jgi:predicted MFS family arabinose efflux permease